MGHGHLHPGESMRDYFTEQLLAILVCGLFGFAAIQMYRNNMLDFLTPNFREPVLYGGIGVLVLVAFRAFTVWKEAGELQAQAVDGKWAAASTAARRERERQYRHKATGVTQNC